MSSTLGKKRVVLGMSGGVDSSVAAYLLKEAGYEVLGLFMKNWDETDENGECTATQDYRDVQKVCAILDIPCYSIEFVEEYRDHVFAEFLKQYQAGFTPNPDVLCNREIKFDLFLKKAEEFGCDYLATGHYCQVDQQSSTPLLRAIDQNKDQTYFLTAVPPSVFKKVLFPIGHLPKPAVREIAKKMGLATHAKKDSTGICFIGERKFKSFLNQYVQTQPGDIVDLDGKPVGRHDGIAFHTLGQRKGLGLGGEGEPWFVVGKDRDKNQLIVTRGTEHPALYSQELWATELNWITHEPLSFPLHCTAKTRYRQQDQECVVYPTETGVRVEFKTPQRAVTPGQYVVFYSGPACLGGGVINRVGPTLHELKLPVKTIGQVRSESTQNMP
jgi:tRNA-specific 2-thiouridylase